MPTYIAFLRAINVGGKNLIPMADLREMIEMLGFKDVKTLLQSGNVIFSGQPQKDTLIEKKLEEATEKRFGFSIDFMVRSTEELDALIEGNPFRKEAKSDPGHLLVLFLKSHASKGSEDALRTAIKGREVVVVKGREAYAMYSDGVGRSKLTNAVLEKHLDTRVTGRNWNTVNKLLNMTKS